MKRMNLCIDIDGTMTEPYYWLERANAYFEARLKPEDIKVYEIHKLFNVEESAYKEFYRQFGKALHRESEIRFGAREAINRLYYYHQIHFVSAREERMREITMEWFKKHEIQMDSITFLGCPYKVCKAEELECDIFIEDSYDNALQLSEAGFDVLLMDCTYNKGALPPNIIRVKSWHQIVKIIENQAQQRFADYKMA